MKRGKTSNHQSTKLLTAMIFTCSMAVGPHLMAESVNFVSCSTPGAFTSGTTACSAPGPYGFASASADSSLALPTSLSQPAQIHVNSSVSALIAGVRGIGSESTAQASSQVMLNFDTTGPVGNGYLELTFLQSEWNVPSFGSASESLSIGSQQFTPDGQSLNAVYIPIQLGTVFSLNYLQTLTGNGDAGSGPADGSIQTAIMLQAFGSDKMTAVELFDPPISASTVATPEPKATGLLSIGMLAALVLIHKFRNQKS